MIGKHRFQGWGTSTYSNWEPVVPRLRSIGYNVGEPLLLQLGTRGSRFGRMGSNVREPLVPRTRNQVFQDWDALANALEPAVPLLPQPIFVKPFLSGVYTGVICFFNFIHLSFCFHVDICIFLKIFFFFIPSLLSFVLRSHSCHCSRSCCWDCPLCCWWWWWCWCRWWRWYWRSWFWFWSRCCAVIVVAVATVGRKPTSVLGAASGAASVRRLLAVCQEEGACAAGSPEQRILDSSLLRITTYQALEGVGLGETGCMWDRLHMRSKLLLVCANSWKDYGHPRMNRII